MPSVRRSAFVAGSLAAVLLCASTGAGAQAAPPGAPVAPIAYASVAAALQDLKARDGQGTVVTQADGWTVVNEPPAAQWSFAPAGHAAYPAVVRRVIRRAPGGVVSVDTQSLCEAPQTACDALLAEFAAMNERIVQAARARGGTAAQRPTAP